MILIVDDTQGIIEWVADVIREAGYPVDCAMDAQAAVDKLATCSYAMALIDIRLRGNITGNDVARTVRALPTPFCDVPLIAMTGSRLDANDDLFTAVLTKPFLPRDLRDAIAMYARPHVSRTAPCSA